FEDKVIENLCENVEGEIPEVMYDNKAKENIDGFANRIRQQGLDVDMYLSYMGLDRESYEKMMRERAVNDVKYELAIEKIVELENFEIPAEEIDKEYADMAEQYKLDVEKIKEIVPVDAVEGQLKRQKAAKLVIDTAVAVAPKPKEDKAEDKAE
ncbi:MAG: trigger factor, partial [Clostridia bacterium]|nr:trigger factor [Clostridia bacterium]